MVPQELEEAQKEYLEREKVKEELYTSRDIRGWLADQQYYTDDSGYIAINHIKTAEEMYKMIEEERINSYNQALKDLAEAVKESQDYPMARDEEFRNDIDATVTQLLKKDI